MQMDILGQLEKCTQQGLNMSMSQKMSNLSKKVSIEDIEDSIILYSNICSSNKYVMHVV